LNLTSTLIFRIVCGVLLGMQTISRIVMTQKSPPYNNNQFFHKKREQIFIRLAGMAVTLAYLYVILPDTAFVDFMIPEWLRWLGAGLMLAGNALFISSHAALGKNWSPALEIRPEHQLVDWGIYRWIRHPMYTGFLLFGFGMLLLSANAFGCAYILVIGVMILTRLSDEEAMLIEIFGEKYILYQSKTAALIPFLF
jgi:protein-S-isoprenylcysteine O-methyltransferase Ste14